MGFGFHIKYMKTTDKKFKVSHFEQDQRSTGNVTRKKLIMTEDGYMKDKNPNFKSEKDGCVR